MLSLRVELSNANRLYGLKSSQRVVLCDSNLIFDLTQSYPTMDYWLEQLPIFYFTLI